MIVVFHHALNATLPLSCASCLHGRWASLWWSASLPSYMFADYTMYLCLYCVMVQLDEQFDPDMEYSIPISRRQT